MAMAQVGVAVNENGMDNVIIYTSHHGQGKISWNTFFQNQQVSDIVGDIIEPL